jgi:Uma2 family endonuclease
MSLLEERLMVTPAFTGRPMTIDDLATLPDDGNRYEIVGGELFVSPSPSTIHQYLSLQLSRLFADFVMESGIGVVLTAPFDVRFDLYNLVQPDIVVVLREHSDRLTASGMRGAPDLVVEILSPSTRAIDEVKKVALYATHGVQEYWIVDPEYKSVTAHHLREERYEVIRPGQTPVRSELLDGFSIDSKEFFQFPSWMTA